MKKRVTAFINALNGLIDFFKNTIHARIHLAAVIAVCAAGFYLEITVNEWLAVLLCMALVLTAEAINSSLEYTVDLVTKEYHPLAEKAKDMAAGAVLIAALFSAIIAAVIFYPYIQAQWQ